MNLHTKLIYTSTGIVFLVCLGLVVFSLVKLYKNPSNHCHSYGLQNISIRGSVQCCFLMDKNLHKDLAPGNCTTTKFKAIELWENDWFSPDDLLNETVTDEVGDFYMTAQQYEYLSISPYIVVYHTCDMDNVHHEDGIYIRHSYYQIPDYYINSNKDYYILINLNTFGYRDYVRKYHY